MPIAISLSVIANTEEQATRVMEVVSRTATGLAFEGVAYAAVSLSQVEDEDAEGSPG